MCSLYFLSGWDIHLLSRTLYISDPGSQAFKLRLKITPLAFLVLQLADADCQTSQPP